MNIFQGDWKSQFEDSIVLKPVWPAGKGLKSHRGEGKHPEYSCDNCKCNRYSPCKCMRKKD